ncbi:hypothetical protein B0H34DRAFT_677762 [Crassisporium funariophilum]|nr:hypothetical protein B0H34DRAFT_677762 [Crassisporium funariophilum]
MFERLHINFAKEGWRASNQCDEFPRMIWWLSRQEKISWFQSQVPSRTPAVSPPTSSIKGKPYISIAKSANHPNCPISSVEVRHNASDFSYYLKLYLNTFTTSPASNRWLDIATTLPFSKVNVYNMFKFLNLKLFMMKRAKKTILSRLSPNPENFHMGDLIPS